MEKTVQSHRDLKVWQKAMDLAVEIYRLTARFPRSETYRLVAQVTRAAASVPATCKNLQWLGPLFPVTCNL